MPDLAQAGAVDALAGDERRPAGRAALLAVGVGEPHPLVGDPVDVRRAIAHQPVAVAAQVRDADVVAPDDDDVRPVRVRHASCSLRLVSRSGAQIICSGSGGRGRPGSVPERSRGRDGGRERRTAPVWTVSGVWGELAVQAADAAVPSGVRLPTSRRIPARNVRRARGRTPGSRVRPAAGSPHTPGT